jgi:hypothetical protein
MFDVRVVGFGVQAVKVLLTAFSLQAKQPEFWSEATHYSMFDVERSMFSVQVVDFQC